MSAQDWKFTWKLWQFIIIAQIFLGLLTLGFVIISFYINQKVLFQIFIESSQHIFQEETGYQLNYNWVQQNHIQQSIESTFQKNQKVSRIQETISKLRDFSTNQPNPCLQDYRYVDSFCFDSSFCYGIFNQSAIEQNNLELTFNLTSILTQYRPVLTEPSTYFTIDDGSKFFTLQSSGFFPKDYDPQLRTWYLTYDKSEQKDRIFGDPYLLFASKKISIPLISELKHDNMHQGVIVTEFNLKNLILDSAQLKMLFYIIDQQGKIIYGKQYLNQVAELFHIYDTNYTGLNLNDWIQMQMYISHSKFNNTCQNPSYLPSNCLCLYNSLEKSDLILEIKPLYNSPYFLFTYKYNDTVFENQNELFQTINRTLNQQLNDNILIFTLSYLGITFLSFLMTQIIMQQTNLVIKYTNSISNGMISQAEKDKILEQLKHVLISSVIINNIFESLLKLSNKGSIKQSPEKLIIDSFQYPQQVFGISVYLSKIYEIIEFDISKDCDNNLNIFNSLNQGKYLSDVLQILKQDQKNRQ